MSLDGIVEKQQEDTKTSKHLQQASPGLHPFVGHSVVVSPHRGLASQVLVMRAGNVAWLISSMVRSLSLQWNSHEVGCERMTVSLVLQRHSLQRGKESGHSTVTGSESNAGEQAANRASHSGHSEANQR